MKKHRNWATSLGGGLLLSAIAAFAVAMPASAADDVLTIGKSGDPDNIDPAVTVTNNSWTASYPAYERLVRFNGGSTDIAPEVAKSWTTSADMLTWTFTLGDGHTFADGKPVDAEAVKFSFDRVIKIGKGPMGSFEAIKSVEAVDPHTVKFTLKEPFAPFLSTLATSGGSIVNPAVMDKATNDDLGQGYLADHTMGSGPYQVKSWEKGQRIVMEPNPKWSGSELKFKEIDIKIIKEASARRLQLENGDLDIAEDIPIDQLQALKSKEGIKVVDEPSLYVTYLYLNNEKPPLDNVKVRQALSYAIDYKGIIDGIMLGQAEQMRGPIPKGLWGHDDTVMQYSYDPQKAKDLLKEAGVSDLSFNYLYAKTDPAWEQIGLVLQQNLADIGVKVKLQDFAYPTMRDKLNTGDFDIAAGNWSPDYGDPSMFMNFWFDSKLKGLPGDRAFYSNPKVDELIRKAAAGTDQKEREALYQEAQKITVEEAPYILLFQRNYQFAMRDNVKGYVYNPMLVQIFNFDSMSKGQ